MAEPRRRPPDDASVARLAALARSAVSADVSADVHARGRDRLVETLEAPAAQPHAKRAWWLVAAASLAAAALVVLVLAWPEPQLSYVVDGAKATSSYVRSGPEGATARFSEGTTVRFAPRAQGRIGAVTRRGARVQVEAGRASFHVVHRPSAEWLAEAGPFTITVTGTEFDVTWSNERLEVELHAGSVVVRGPLVSEGVALHAGQTLLVDVARGELTISDANESPPARGGAPASAGVPAPSAIPARTPPVPSSGRLDPELEPSARPEAPTWRARVAGGDFTGVLAEADARGIDASLNETSLSDLAALADAARYAGRADLAQRALGAERTRFPGSAEARSAAFLLGRMVETSQPSAAIGWYDRYLAESAGGSLAAEALGRKMVTVAKVSGRDAARPIADEYLRRFPGGAFTAAANDLVGGR
jgi:FecR protein